MSQEKILAGKIHDPDLNFTFEVWAYRIFEDEEVLSAFRSWRQSERKDISLRGLTVKTESNSGADHLRGI